MHVVGHLLELAGITLVRLMAGIALTCSSRDNPDSSSGRSISSYFLDSLVHVFFMSFTEVGCLGAAGVYSWHWYCRCWCWCAGSVGRSSSSSWADRRRYQQRRPGRVAM
ncbi:hypothetical protein JYU34_003021 [Plutella xylostella]|uniref:Secreted protein n=1 Tax=Plutella xylostella TaxID=51655 RepID=A0ABQ7QYY2_PLUXY|nr:hypothetical protein JYU34_003021 [Plutella xylostella]